ALVQGDALRARVGAGPHVQARPRDGPALPDPGPRDRAGADRADPGARDHVAAGLPAVPFEPLPGLRVPVRAVPGGGVRLGAEAARVPGPPRRLRRGTRAAATPAAGAHSTAGRRRPAARVRPTP